MQQVLLKSSLSFVLRSPLNSTVGSSLNSDGTRRDESPTSTTDTGTSITSRRLVICNCGHSLSHLTNLTNGT